MGLLAVIAHLVPEEDPNSSGFVVGQKLLIGRKECCSIRLQGATVSAIQCEIAWNPQAGHFELTDRSSNGTFVNGDQLQKGQVAPLRHGDKVQLTKKWQQHLSLQFSFVTSQQARPPAMMGPLAAHGAKVELPPSALEAPAPKLAQSSPRRKPGEFHPGDACAEEAAQKMIRELQNCLADAEAKTGSLKSELAAVQQEFALVEEAVAESGSSTPARGEGFGVTDSTRADVGRADAGGMQEAELAVQEAESHQLAMQRAALEQQLAERRAALEQTRQEVEAEAVAAKATSEQTMHLTAKLEASLQQAAREEGIRGAHRELIQDCQRAQNQLQASLEDLLGARAGMQEAAARHREDTEANRTVENSLTALAAEKSSAIKSLQEDLQELVSDMRLHSNSLVECIDGHDVAGADHGQEEYCCAASAPDKSSISFEPTLLVPSQPELPAAPRRPLGRLSGKENMGTTVDDVDYVHHEGAHDPSPRSFPPAVKRLASSNAAVVDRPRGKRARPAAQRAGQTTAREAPADGIEDLCSPEDATIR